MAWAMTVAGTTRSNNFDQQSLEIWDNINEQPNTATFECFGFTPAAEDAVIIGNPTVTGSDRVFRGKITDIAEVHGKLNLGRTVYRVSCVDYTRDLDKTLVTKKYTATSATTIAQALISNYTSGFTSTNVAASLPSVDIAFKMEPVSDCLTLLARTIGGYWYLDEDLDLHFFLTESSGNPTDITTANLLTRNFKYGRNNDQIRNRIFVEGLGSLVTTRANQYDTVLNVDDSRHFNTSGGLAVVDNQVLTYTGLRQGRTWGKAWTIRTTSPAQIPFHVCWSPGLNLWAACCASHVFTSPDGIDWTDRSVTSPVWCRIAWSPELSLFCAIAQQDPGGTGKYVMTSPDGITWTARTASTNTTWQDICWASSLGLFVAVATSGATRVMTSPDGITWTNRTAAALDTWSGVAWSPALSLLVAVGGASATQSVMTSPDGITWTLRTCATGPTAVCWSPELAIFCAMGDTVRTSTDGITWTLRTSANANAWRDICWAPELGLFFASSNLNSASNNNVQTSPDGITWTAWATADTSTWRSINYSPQLGQVCATQSSSSTKPFQLTESTPFAKLTGIPPTGTGAIVDTIAGGAEVHLLVQRDDAGSQASYGIREFYVQGRVTKDAADDRGDAELTVRKDPIVRGSYSTTDSNTRSGKSVVINQHGLNITATIMKVRIYIMEGSPLVQRDVDFATLIDKSDLYAILRKLNRERAA